MPATPTVSHDAAAGQFAVDTGSGIAVLKYVRRGDVLDLLHTTVPQAAEGRGVGAALARAALEHARQEGLKVIPTCPFVHSYLRKHKEFADLVAAV
jgi:hypothetical protein